MITNDFSQTKPSETTGSTGSNSSIGIKPLAKKPFFKNPKFNLILGGLVLLLLVIGVGTGLYLSSQEQDNRNQAATFNFGQEGYSSNPDAITSDPESGNGSRVYGVDLSKDTEAVRTKPTLMFVNAAPTVPEEPAGIIVRKDDQVLIDNKGFGTQMAVEMAFDPGNYSVEVINGKTGESYYKSPFSLGPNEVTLLIRGGDGKSKDDFSFDRILHDEMAMARFYNFSKDQNLNLIGGSLQYYDTLQKIDPGYYRELALTTPSLTNFMMLSGLPQLDAAMVDIKNPNKHRLFFFAFDGLDQKGKLSILTVPLRDALPESQNPPKQPSGFDASNLTPMWCEGEYSCELTNKSCASCGKICYPTPDSCSQGSNGGSGLRWNGSKNTTPKNL